MSERQQTSSSDRNSQYLQASESFPDVRIEIHGTDSNPRIQQQSFNDTPQQNFTSFFSQARGELERRTEQTVSWRNNFYNVIQGVRPLVQQARLQTWVPNANNTNYVPLRNEFNSVRGNEQLSNVIINTNSDNSSANANHISNVASSSERRSSGIARPLQDRIVALTRDDPPNLIERSVGQRTVNGIGGHARNDDGIANDVFAEMPEARRYFDMLVRYIPYICIIITKSAYDHFDIIGDIATLYFVFIHANNVVKDQISKQAQRKLITLIRELFYIISITFFRFIAIGKTDLVIRFFFTYSEPLSLGQLLYTVIKTDLMLKLVTIVIKIAITMLPCSIFKYNGRARIYVLTESLSQLYRSLVTIQHWLVFLLDSYTGTEKILGVLFSTAYMVSKGFNILERVNFCKRSFINLLRKISYGNIPTKEQLQQSGAQCPICHESYDFPVILNCNHIFCESCVGAWFARKQTCPLCRAKVAEDPSWQDGATSYFLQLY